MAEITPKEPGQVMLPRDTVERFLSLKGNMLFTNKQTQKGVKHTTTVNYSIQTLE